MERRIGGRGRRTFRRDGGGRDGRGRNGSRRGWRRGWSGRTLAVGAAYAATLVLYVTANKLTTAANSIFLQATVAPDYQGRVFALYGSLATLVAPRTSNWSAASAAIQEYIDEQQEKQAEALSLAELVETAKNDVAA